MIDIPTALTPVEAEALTLLAAGKRVLEVGSLLGYSTVTMALVAEEVVSIDPHSGYPAANPRDTWFEFNANLERYGVDDRVDAIRATDEILAAPEKFSDEMLNRKLEGLTFDLAFIDADGTYETTIRIIERVESYVTIDNPIIAVHDYGLLAWPGAGEAVRDYCTQRQLTFGLVDTLALIRPAHPDD